MPPDRRPCHVVAPPATPVSPCAALLRRLAERAQSPRVRAWAAALLAGDAAERLAGQPACGPAGVPARPDAGNPDPATHAG